MTGICKVKHAPERSVRVWFGYLEEREIGRIRRWKGELVDGRYDAGVGDRPFQIAGGFATDDARGRGR
jgi:hypothetical protein